MSDPPILPQAAPADPSAYTMETLCRLMLERNRATIRVQKTAFALPKSHPAFALHLMYWHLPAAFSGMQRTPPSHLRELVG